jgi:hypothetical protein
MGKAWSSDSGKRGVIVDDEVRQSGIGLFHAGATVQGEPDRQAVSQGSPQAPNASGV